MEGNFTRKLEMARQRLGELNTAGVYTSQLTGCDPTLNEIGDRTAHATGYWFTPTNKGFCILYTADCSGTLEYAYVRHNGNTVDNAKVCVYLDDGDTVPDVSDTQVGNCVTVTSNGVSTAWETSAAKVTGSVTNGSKYWICLVADTTEWAGFYTSSGSRTLYVNTSFNYASPPSNLAGTWTTSSGRDYSWYVRIE